MRGSELAAWEVRSAILSGRASELRNLLADQAFHLTPLERSTLERLIERLVAAAHDAVIHG
jgi:hypothetical protein